MQEEGYSDYEISIRMRSTDKQWNKYLEERERDNDEDWIYDYSKYDG